MKKKKKDLQIEKDEGKIQEYVLKKNTGKVLIRAVFWLILIFFFTRGIVTALRPNSMAEINNTVSQFKKDFNGYKDADSQMLSFAESFVKEYFTYGVKEEESYKLRIKPYVSDRVINAEYDFKNEAKVLYARGYKKTAYSKNQYDVFVVAEVEYRKKILNKNGTQISDEVTKQKTYIKIPLSANGTKYIVEDVPAIINDEPNLKLDGYESKAIELQEVSGQERDVITQSLESFFVAYYEEEQTRINYYLAESASEHEFKGLNGRITLDEITNVTTYRKSDGSILAIVSLKARDKNDVLMLQTFNITLLLKDDKYFIKDMDTRTRNLK